MSTRVASLPSAGRHWVRLRYVGEGETPNRSEVGANLLHSQWINATDVHSFIALPNRKDYEICFIHEQTLLRFSQIFNNNTGSGFWKTWEMTTSAPHDIKYLVVKFWTGRIPDEDVEQYLTRFCDILQPVYKPVDQFGFWYGVRRYKAKIKKDPEGNLMSIPNSISMGPYNGTITYPGQVQRCFICKNTDHQVKDCDKQKCWKCGSFGHKGKVCENMEICNLCHQHGHNFFQCPTSYSNKLKIAKQQKRVQTKEKAQETVQEERQEETREKAQEKTQEKPQEKIQEDRRSKTSNQTQDKRQLADWEEKQQDTNDTDSTSSGSGSTDTSSGDSEDTEGSESSDESSAPEQKQEASTKLTRVDDGMNGATQADMDNIDIPKTLQIQDMEDTATMNLSGRDKNQPEMAIKKKRTRISPAEKTPQKKTKRRIETTTA